MKNFLDHFQTIGEYLIAALFIYGGVSIIGMPPLEGEGLVVKILGGEFALYFYMILFIALGVGLIIGKLKKKKRLHKHMLLGMYLTTIYTFFLTIALFGFAPFALIDDTAVGLLTAYWWLRWKFRTEYISQWQFASDVEELRQDPLRPPT